MASKQSGWVEMQRVKTIDGKLPVIIFAPHGFNGNDQNTSLIAESIATQIKANAVINLGWERSDIVDCINDKADCNSVHHCHQDVVKEEILDPLMRYVQKAKLTNDFVYVFNIHGMSDHHRIVAKDKLDLVIGFGEGDPPSLSMDIWRKNFMMSRLIGFGINAYEGKSGGKFSGWAKSNMNQLFRKWYPEPKVQSIQIELTHEIRSTEAKCLLTAVDLAIAIEDLISTASFSSMATFKNY